MRTLPCAEWRGAHGPYVAVSRPALSGSSLDYPALRPEAPRGPEELSGTGNIAVRAQNLGPEAKAGNRGLQWLMQTWNSARDENADLGGVIPGGGAVISISTALAPATGASLWLPCAPHATTCSCPRPGGAHVRPWTGASERGAGMTGRPRRATVPLGRFLSAIERKTATMTAQQLRDMVLALARAVERTSARRSSSASAQALRGRLSPARRCWQKSRSSKSEQTSVPVGADAA